MNFKFSLRYYQLSLFFVWFLFISRAVYLLLVVDRDLIFVELVLSAIITQLSVGSFLKTLYKYKMVRFIDVFKIASFVYLNLHYLTIANAIDSPENSFFQIYFIDPDYIVTSLSAIVAGMLALDLADFLFRLKLKKKDLIKNRINFPTLSTVSLKRKNIFLFLSFFYLLMLIVLVATGLAGYTESIDSSDNSALGSFSALFQIFAYLSPLIILTYLMIVFLKKEQNQKFNNYFKIFIILYIFVSLYGGAKGPVIIIAVQVLIFHLAGGGKFPKIAIIVAVPIILLVFPVVSNYRNALRSDSNRGRLELFVEAATNTFSGKYKDDESSSKKFSDRLSMFTTFSYSVEFEKDWDAYKHLDRYPYLPVSFIPRVIIPSKPINDTGGILNYKVFGLRGSSITPTTYGWSYFEGGILYLFISFFILGIVLSYIQYFFRANAGLYFLYSLYTMFNLIVVENDVYFMISGQIAGLFVCWAFVKYFYVDSKS